jgi:hypothetical protein
MRHCASPLHLEAVTRQQNCSRRAPRKYF